MNGANSWDGFEGPFKKKLGSSLIIPVRFSFTLIAFWKKSHQKFKCQLVINPLQLLRFTGFYDLQGLTKTWKHSTKLQVAFFLDLACEWPI